MTIAKTHTLPGFANVEVGCELKLTNLTGMFRVVSFDKNDYASMRRVHDTTDELESGQPFVAKLEHLNIDWVEWKA